MRDSARAAGLTSQGCRPLSNPNPQGVAVTYLEKSDDPRKSSPVVNSISALPKLAYARSGMSKGATEGDITETARMTAPHARAAPFCVPFSARERGEKRSALSSGEWQCICVNTSELHSSNLKISGKDLSS